MFKLFRKPLLIVVLLGATQAMGQTPDSAQKATPSPPPPAATGKLLDLGYLQGDAYTNDFFKLSLAVPHDWQVVSAQRRAQVAQDSKEMIRAQDESKQAQVNASFDRSTNLLSLTKLPAGQPGNASFMLIAERVPSPAIKDGADVLRSMERLAKDTNFTIEFQDPIHTAQVNDTDFGMATIRVSSPLGVFKQKIYVTVKNGYALQFFLTYRDDADLTPFEGIMKSVKLK